MKERYWCCKECGNVIRRYKNNNINPMCCDDYMSPTRTKEKFDRKRFKLRTKKQKKLYKIYNLKDRYYSKVRNCGGKILRVSKETKQLWKLVSKAKQKPTIIKRSQEWLKSLEKDSRNVDENDMAIKIHNDGSISKSKGGFTYPKISLKGKGYSLHGQYRAGILFGGAFIDIYGGNRTANEIKHTIIHEALHYLDDLSNIPCNGHDRYFKLRLKELEKKFKL